MNIYFLKYINKYKKEFIYETFAFGRGEFDFAGGDKGYIFITVTDSLAVWRAGDSLNWKQYRSQETRT